MTDLYIALFLLLIVLGRFLKWLSRKRRSTRYTSHNLGAKTFLQQLQAKRVYADDSNASHVFRSKKHNISARPDFIYQLSDGTHAIIEYKSSKRIYSSAIQQLLATAVAVIDDTSTKYRPSVGYVLLPNGQYHRQELPETSDEIIPMIEKNLAAARMIALDKKPDASPSRNKCRSCKQRNQCEYAA